MVIVRRNKGVNNLRFILIGRLVGVEGEEYPIFQVGYIYSDLQIPTYTWMTEKELRASYGARKCQDIAVYDLKL